MEEEASADQLAAPRGKLDLDVVPFADFGVFRPYSERLKRALRFQAQIWCPEECSYVTRELPGPSSFEEWRRAWRVYRYALLVLGAASHAHLERYFERFQDLVVSHGTLGGNNLWWILALADQRMRSER